nr:NAD(P)-binding protein [Propionicimonas sp.]
MRILIVGAGIAGPTLAYWLHSAGHEITLVERAPKLREGGYLVDFWGAGFDVAEKMGIVPELRRRGYVFTEARVVDRAGRRVASLRPAEIMRSGERYVSITRSDLASVIYGALGGAAELVLGDTVASLDDLGDRVRVGLESGRVEEFDLVVGRTVCTPGCAGSCSGRMPSTRSTSASSSRRSRPTDTGHATNSSP